MHIRAEWVWVTAVGRVVQLLLLEAQTSRGYLKLAMSDEVSMTPLAHHPGCSQGRSPS
jgi:hypothetical protein